MDALVGANTGTLARLPRHWQGRDADAQMTVTYTFLWFYARNERSETAPA